MLPMLRTEDFCMHAHIKCRILYRGLQITWLSNIHGGIKLCDRCKLCSNSEVRVTMIIKKAANPET